MPKMVYELSNDEYYDLIQLQDLETLLTKSVHVLRLNLPSRGKLLEEVREAIKKIEEG